MKVGSYKEKHQRLPKKKKKLNVKDNKTLCTNTWVSIIKLGLSQYARICQDTIQQFGCWHCAMWC
jgi:hypothetical protein